jgi:hypothetical protein
MRIAVSGSHGTGKSQLIAAFLERSPGYLHEPEAYESVADDVDLFDSVPGPDGLRVLLDHTIAACDRLTTAADVIFELSPADYLAYAIAGRSRWSSGAEDFVRDSREDSPRIGAKSRAD